MQLQTSKFPRNRDHFPLVATFRWKPKSLNFTCSPPWNQEKLSLPPLYSDDWRQVQDTLENNILDTSLLERFDKLAAEGKPDALWSLLQEEMFTATACLRKGKCEYKTFPGEETQRLRERRSEILAHRAAVYMPLDLEIDPLCALRTILHSWLWTVRNKNRQATWCL